MPAASAVNMPVISADSTATSLFKKQRLAEIPMDKKKMYYMLSTAPLPLPL